MDKKKLFDEDSDENIDFKTENEFAKKYDSWREKEELHKLEQKYGSKTLDAESSSASDSEEDSDEPPEVSKQIEEQFLQTLAMLKTKDERIYDPNYKCFSEAAATAGGDRPQSTAVSFQDSDDEDSDGDGAVFKVESAGAGDRERGAGVAERGSDTTEGGVPAPLRALWADPALPPAEAFLRDYILHHRYLEQEAAGAGPGARDEEALEEDARRVEEQGRFERAYNFRFEEPDHEYLKRFPRTVSYVRPRDERRARHRAEVRDRKERDKRQKMEEIARLKALKLKEIQEKIAKIKEVTGNEELAFEEEDLEGDWDPEEHDRRMGALFDEQYYEHEDDTKPRCPAVDDELEIENWERYEEGARGGDEPHCEDEDFNMDAEQTGGCRGRAGLLEEIQSTLGKKRRNRKRKSKLARVLARQKPTFVPSSAEARSYAAHMEQYYAMDCEDVIAGDLRTRFKYRPVPANDYGLSVEEILLADDKELTQWVPLKKILKPRGEGEERARREQFQRRAADLQLKRRVLPSLFRHLPEEPEISVVGGTSSGGENEKKNIKSRTDRRGDAGPELVERNGDDGSGQRTKVRGGDGIDGNGRGGAVSGRDGVKKKKKHKDNSETGTSDPVGDRTQRDARVKKKIKFNQFTAEDAVRGARPARPDGGGGSNKTAKRKRGPRRTLDGAGGGGRGAGAAALSDARLRAYGLNPKRYRGFLKYRKF